MYRDGDRGTAATAVAGGPQCRRRLKELAAFSLSLSLSSVLKGSLFSELQKMKETI